MLSEKEKSEDIIKTLISRSSYKPGLPFSFAFGTKAAFIGMKGWPSFDDETLFAKINVGI